ncbi:hypothetical protein [Fodinicola feengrottensis]|uniref:Uncharacterized protein n=1 Tax=Fodinicola feengrottensis TaxID=435914 RepID=A0ABN2J7W1_9ACTN|nr:hypothetical protein [Fodinicola feengrottensis]
MEGFGATSAKTAWEEHFLTADFVGDIPQYVTPKASSWFDATAVNQRDRRKIARSNADGLIGSHSDRAISP